MSDDPIYVIERETDPDGTQRQRRQLYRPPACPVREFIIVERESKAGILVCPGTHELARPSENPAPYGTPGRRQKGDPAPVKDVYRGYRPLRNPADLMHATRFTETEAVAFCRAQKWALETHRICREPKPKTP